MYERILNILLILSLGAILGAVSFFGLGVAGVLFNAELLPSRTIAGGLNARILERLMVLLTSSAIIALGSSLPLFFSRPRRTNVVVFGSLLLLAPMAIYLALSLFPEIDSLRVAIGSFDPVLTAKEDLHVRFSELHARFSLLIRIGFGLGMIALVAHLLAIVSRRERDAPLEQDAKHENPPLEPETQVSSKRPEPRLEYQDESAVDRPANETSAKPGG